MAFPLTKILDTFGDPSAPRNLSVYSANWAAYTVFGAELQTNADGHAHDQGGTSADYWTTTFSPFQEVYVTVYSLTGALPTTAEVQIRAQAPPGSGDSYGFSVASDGSWSLLLRQGGSTIGLASGTIGSYASGSVIALRGESNTLTAFHNGTVISSVTDSTFPSIGKIAIVKGVGGTVGSFGGGELFDQVGEYVTHRAGRGAGW